MNYFFSTTNHWYGFWSGIGSDIGEFAILGVLWKKLNCHAKGCYRIGLHRVSDGHFVVCRKHHPEVPNSGATVEHIHETAS